jgi:hypothetical protein
MPDPLIYSNGYSRSPKALNGALVQLIPDIVGFLPNVVVFQYQPATITRALTPWNPMAVDPADRGTQAPTVQPFDVPEKFTGFELTFDATDALAADLPTAQMLGVEPQLAALRKMTRPSQGVLGDLTASFRDLAGLGSARADRPTVAPVILVLGRRIALPVRITDFSVEETMMSPLLYPIMAKVSLSMEVMTPDMFRCSETAVSRIAVAAYNLTRLHEDEAAVANLANMPSIISTLVPL